MTLPLLGPSSSPLSGSPAWGALNLQLVLGGRGRRAEGSLRDRGLLALSVCVSFTQEQSLKVSRGSG